jgi:hypothetical protein
MQIPKHTLLLLADELLICTGVSVLLLCTVLMVFCFVTTVYICVVALTPHPTFLSTHRFLECTCVCVCVCRCMRICQSAWNISVLNVNFHEIFIFHNFFKSQEKILVLIKTDKPQHQNWRMIFQSNIVQKIRNPHLIFNKFILEKFPF